MPDGKPAGVRCVQLDAQNLCLLFGLPERPLFCSTLQPAIEMCGQTQQQAMIYLVDLEQLTLPN